MTYVDVAIVGAGPCGLAAAIAAGQRGLSAVVFDRSCLVSGVASYPTYMTFFSTAERLSIGGVPFVVATEKPTRRDALAYYRAVTAHFGLAVRQYEPVEEVVRLDDAAQVAGGGARRPRFVVRSRSRDGVLHETSAHAVVVATGYFGHPNRLGVPGEKQPHVTHIFHEGHEGFDQPVVVVGGGNSAVDAALDLYRSGARVTLVHFGPALDRNIKPWVLPDIQNRIAEGSIAARFDSRVTAIEPREVELATPSGPERIAAEHVYLMLGYQPNAGLLRQLGVPIDPATGIPTHDPTTMETALPGVFIAGVLASGYDANKTFIENGRDHGTLIAERLAKGETSARASGR
jgi:thioredoxin reductase (NADPH)